MPMNMFVPSLGDVTLGVIFLHAGAPSNGTNGTYANVAGPGDMLIDTTNLNLYMLKGTSASPTWTQITVP
jgi:hypothetical protein